MLFLASRPPYHEAIISLLFQPAIIISLTHYSRLACAGLAAVVIDDDGPRPAKTSIIERHYYIE